MGDVAMTHPDTGAVVVVPDSAMPHYRLSGWTTVGEAQEHAEHVARMAALQARAAEAVENSKQASSRPAAAKKSAGGGD